MDKHYIYRIVKDFKIYYIGQYNLFTLFQLFVYIFSCLPSECVDDSIEDIDLEGIGASPGFSDLSLMDPHLILCSKFLDFTFSALVLDIFDPIFRRSWAGFSFDSKDEAEQNTGGDMEFFETSLDVLEIVVVVVKFWVVRGIEFRYSMLNLTVSPLKVESLKLNFRLSWNSFLFCFKDADIFLSCPLSGANVHLFSLNDVAFRSLVRMQGESRGPPVI